MHDLIIIGGGAAGLAAASYAHSKQLDTLVIANHLGGKAGWHQQLLGQATSEYIAGEEVVQQFERELRKRDGGVISDLVTRIANQGGLFQVETAHHGQLESTAVIIATGVSPIRLDVPGAEELMGHGLGYSATTHAPVLSGKSVAMVGATERALRGVYELSHIASKVYLIVTNRADLLTPLGIALQYRPNVDVLIGYRVAEVAGAFSVEEIQITNGEEQRCVPVDAVFVDLGLKPNSDLVRLLARVEVNGLIRVDERNSTTLPGLFAAGDVTTTFSEHILIAIGEGARAAMSAHTYILAHPMTHDIEAVRR
jgi:thioredoxin reductase